MRPSYFHWTLLTEGLVYVLVPVLILSVGQSGLVVSHESREISGTTYSLGTSLGVQTATNVRVGELSDYVPAAGVEAQVSGLYSVFSQKSTYKPDVEPAPTIVAAEVQNSFEALSQLPAFSGLMHTVGLAGFTLGLGSQLSGRISEATYSFTWTSGDTTYQTYWTASLDSSQTSGPVTESYPLFSNSNLTGSSYRTSNWAGPSYWGSGSPDLTVIESTQYVPTVSCPSQTPEDVPSGDAVFPWYSQWIGFTNSANDILQTGFVDTPDCTSYGAPYTYSWFWEYYPCNAAQPIADMPDTSAGHEVTENIFYSSVSSEWYVYVADDSTGSYQSFGLNGQTCSASGYKPQYTNFIVEAPTYDGVIQQIGEFSPSVTFYDIDLCSPSECWQPSDASSNLYYMEQSSSGYNVIPTGASSPYVTWETSAYNYDYIYD